ncbi:MAG: hypothetical protein ACTHJM_10905 [Marmoricola sp.]
MERRAAHPWLKGWHLPEVVNSWTVFEEVAWELVAAMTLRLETAQNGLASSDEIRVIKHCRNELERMARSAL